MRDASTSAPWFLTIAIAVFVIVFTNTFLAGPSRLDSQHPVLAVGTQTPAPFEGKNASDDLLASSVGGANDTTSSAAAVEEPLSQEQADGADGPRTTHEPLRDQRGNIVNPVRRMDPMRSSVFVCPKFRRLGNDADKKKVGDHIVKYSRYAADYCNTTGLMQMNIPQHAHIQMLSTIARMAHVKQNDRVLDWGCGCGTMLNYLHLQFNTTGVGLDMTEGAIKFAWDHSQPRQTFCWMDGSDMSPFPSSHFDAVVSWGGIYHVRRTQIQCQIITNFVRILKPGGVAFVGHIRTDKSQQYWKQNKCVPPNSSVVRYRDYKTFRQSSWKRHGFFSLVVTRHA